MQRELRNTQSRMRVVWRVASHGTQSNEIPLFCSSVAAAAAIRWYGQLSVSSAFQATRCALHAMPCVDSSTAHVHRGVDKGSQRARGSLQAQTPHITHAALTRTYGRPQAHTWGYPQAHVKVRSTAKVLSTGVLRLAFDCGVPFWRTSTALTAADIDSPDASW